MLRACCAQNLFSPYFLRSTNQRLLLTKWCGRICNVCKCGKLEYCARYQYNYICIQDTDDYTRYFLYETDPFEYLLYFVSMALPIFIAIFIILLFAVLEPVNSHLKMLPFYLQLWNSFVFFCSRPYSASLTHWYCCSSCGLVFCCFHNITGCEMYWICLQSF